MAEEGRRELPRPPRRVPPQAQQQTVLEPGRRGPDGPVGGSGGRGTPEYERPLPPRFRFRFVLPLIVFVLVLGVGAGWLVREDALRLDADEVLKKAGPSVVRVLATTCAGTGEATGVLLPDGLILTAASAINQPMSMVIMTTDGRVRRANPLGTSADGVAVLQLVGRLDTPTAELAPKEPSDRADRALLGFIQAGTQTINPLGTAKEPRPLSSVLNSTKLGAPVLDKSGQVIGLVTGDKVPTATMIPLSRLRQYVVPQAAELTPEAGGKCARSKGPQSGITPALQVSKTPLAVEAQAMLGGYLTTMNQHDFKRVRDYYTKRLAGALSEQQDRLGHETFYGFGAKITEVTQSGEAVNVRMTFTALFSSNSRGAQGRTCSRLDNRYRLIRQAGTLRLDEAKTVTAAQGCDTD